MAPTRSGTPDADELEDGAVAHAEEAEDDDRAARPSTPSGGQRGEADGQRRHDGENDGASTRVPPRRSASAPPTGRSSDPATAHSAA